MSSTTRRWLPAVAIPTAIVLGAVLLPGTAGASVDLPDKTAEQVLAMLAGSAVSQLSGTLEQSSDLGLPALPGGFGPSDAGDVSAASTLMELVSAPHTARVFADGPTRVRVQVLDPLSERDLIRNDRDVWLYSSQQNTVQHLTVPTESPEQRPGDSGLPTAEATPQQLASWVVASLAPTSDLAVGRDARVAGRDAYELVVRPRADVETLVESVSLSVDAQTGMALAGSIRARGQQQDAWRVSFTDLSLDAPDPDLFQFSPPPGASVEQVDPEAAHGTSKAPAPTAGEPEVTGQGWDAVVEVPGPGGSGDAQAAAMLAALGNPVPGGSVISTSLLNVLVTDDGRMLAGAVPVARLLDVAAGR